MIEHNTLPIGGHWETPSGSKRIDVFSPSDESQVGSVPEAEVADLEKAVALAQNTLQKLTLKSWPAEQRAACLRAMADRIEGHDELARLVAMESGIPISLTRPGLKTCAERFRYYADLVESFAFETAGAGAQHMLVHRREPVGIVAAIVPWNAPLTIAVTKLAPAFAAGCPAILKPAPETPLCAFALAQICYDAGLPEGMLSVLPAREAVSEALVRHPLVRLVSFTGSTSVGRHIGSICGQALKRSTLELGGKSAAIVLDDVALEDVLPRLIAATTLNSGQACVLQSRVLVPRARQDEICAALAHGIGSLKVGDALDPATQIGPLATQRQRERVEGYMDAAKREGARLLLGCGRPENLPRGWFVQPTVFDQVLPDMQISREEIFGPVTAIISYDDCEEALNIANASEYGLSGTVWTSDIARGLEVARRVESGNFGVNLFGMDVCAPFGGRKASGFGRELGRDGLSELLDAKAIHMSSDFTAEQLASFGVPAR